MAFQLNTGIHPRTPHPGRAAQPQGQGGPMQALQRGKDTVEVLRQGVMAFKDSGKRKQLKDVQMKANMGQATMEDFRALATAGYPLEAKNLMEWNETMAQNLTPAQKSEAVEKANIAARWLYGALANLQSVPPEKRAQRYGQIMNHVTKNTEWGQSQMGQQAISGLMAMTTMGAQGLDDSVIARAMMAVTSFGEGLDDLKADLGKTVDRGHEVEDETRERGQDIEDRDLDREEKLDDRALDWREDMAKRGLDLEEQLRREGREDEANATKSAREDYQRALDRADKINRQGQEDALEREKIAARGGGDAELLDILSGGEGGEADAPAPAGNLDEEFGSYLKDVGASLEGGVVNFEPGEEAQAATGPEEKPLADNKNYRITSGVAGSGMVQDKKTGQTYRMDRGQLVALRKGNGKIVSLDDGPYLKVGDRKIKLQAA